jgi:hypothetical protein
MGHSVAAGDIMGPYYRASAVSLTTADYARCQALYEGTQGGAAGARSGGSSSCCGVCGPRYARLVQREGADSSVHVVERGADSGGERTPREVRENNIKVRKTPSVFLLHFPFSFSFLFSMIFFSTSKQVVCQDRLGTDSGLFMRKAQNNQPKNGISVGAAQVACYVLLTLLLMLLVALYLDDRVG